MRIARPRVRLIAYTVPEGGRLEGLPILAVKVSQGKLRDKTVAYYVKEYPEKKPDTAEYWIEAAAEHFPSVLEHITFTFLIEGISRVCSHQLVRHRLASYTQESQRYWVVDHPEIVLPGLIKEKGLDKEFLELCEKAHELYKRMIEAGVPPEDARYILPQAFTTKILMTVNLRELLHIAKLRLAPEAQWEIRVVVRQMIEEASKAFPPLRKLVEKIIKGFGDGCGAAIQRDIRELGGCV